MTQPTINQPYLVHVKSGVGQDQAHTLQVVAGSPQEAVGAIRRAVGGAAIIEVDPVPLSAERAREAGVISGKVLLA